MVKWSLSWVNTLVNSSKKIREEWVKIIIEGIRSYRNEKEDKGKYLSDVLVDENEYEMIGLGVNACYVKVDGPKELLNALWVHAFGSPVLMLKHKKLPVIVLAGPGIRYNSSILQEHGIDKSKVMGITG